MWNIRRLISHEMEGASARDVASTLSPMLLMRHVQEFDPSNTGAVQTLNLGTDDIGNRIGDFTTKARAGVD